MFRKLHSLLLLLFLILALAPSVCAQSPGVTPDVLTNADVVKMVEAKLADDLIITKIKTSSGKFDTTVDAILKLKAAGASDSVIRAVAEVAPATPAKEAAVKERVQDPNDPMSPHAPGIYWTQNQQATKHIVSLEPTTYSQSKCGAGVFKMTCKIAIPADRAALRMTEAAPEFWFYFATEREAFSSSGPSGPDDFVLARLEVKSKERQLAVGQGGMTGIKAGVRKQDTVSVESKQVAPGIYQVRVGKPLEPGEYAFMRAAVTLESASSGKVFDFGIDRAK